MIQPQRDEFIRAGDLTLHFVKWGAAGPPVICIHGITSNAYFFQAFADGLATNHQVYAYDLRGRGDSDKPAQGYSVPIHAADLLNLIEALGLERPIIIGHSLGALIALYFAAHYPEKLSKLVLVDAGAPWPWKRVEDQPAWLTASVSRIGTSIPSFSEYTTRLRMLPFIGLFWNEYFAMYFEHDVAHNQDGSVVSKCYRDGIMEEGQHFFDVHPEEQWEHVQVPTLLLRAGQGLFTDNDQILSEEAAAEVQRSIKGGCRLVNYPTLNHYTIIMGDVKEVVGEIRMFVDFVIKE